MSQHEESLEQFRKSYFSGTEIERLYNIDAGSQEFHGWFNDDDKFMPSCCRKYAVPANVRSVKEIEAALHGSLCCKLSMESVRQILDLPNPADNLGVVRPGDLVRCELRPTLNGVAASADRGPVNHPPVTGLWAYWMNSLEPCWTPEPDIPLCSYAVAREGKWHPVTRQSFAARAEQS